MALMASFVLLSLYPHKKKVSVPILQEAGWAPESVRMLCWVGTRAGPDALLGGHQSRSGCFEEDNNPAA